MEKISRRLFYIYRNCYYSPIGRAEWMIGICLIWSRGRLISPPPPSVCQVSVPYLTKRPEISGVIVWYEALAPRPELLLSWCFLCACAALLNSSTYYIRGIKWIVKGQVTTWQCSRRSLVQVSLTCRSVFHSFVDQNFVPKIDHFCIQFISL